MSVLPIVTPAHNADGIALMPSITALYPFQLDEGSVSTVNCFLVKKISSLGNNSTTPVPIKVSLKRIQPGSNLEFQGSDYADDNLAGHKYRSQIVIEPSTQLDPHTEYSVILSRDVAKISVFDVKPNSTNTSGNVPLVKGPYSGMGEDQYKIQIIVGGNENTATYKVIRQSNDHVFNNLVAKKRFIEIEKELFVKFPAGTYVAGDFYTVAVQPLVKTNEIYSWDFTTGDSNYVKPADSNSGVIVGLPVQAPEVSTPVPTLPTTPTPSTGFKLVSVSPSPNSMMNNISNKTVTFTFNKDINPDSVTSETIKIIAESTATNYYGSLDYTHAIDGKKLIITFQ